MPSLRFLAPNFFKTFQRFPVPVIFSFVLFVLTLGVVQDKGILTYAFHILGSGFYMFAIARLAAEAYGWKSSGEAIFGVAGTFISFLVLMVYFSPLTYMLLGVIFILMVLTVPFAFRASDDLSFWAYQQSLSTGVTMAFLGSALLAGGLCVALVSVQYLFGVKIPKDAYIHIFAFAAIVYGPFNALSWVPGKFHTEPAECHAAPGLPFMLNWILAPLAVLYFLILYGYGIKILMEGELPRGNVAYMVSGFGALGILIYVSGWIMRDTGNALVRFLYRHFFKLLILPVVLLGFGIYARIAEYGVTEPRYYVVLLAVWFGAMALLYTFRPRAPLKIVLSALAVLLILSAFGPWGAIGVSERSQYGRLTALLEKNDMLADGKAVPAKGPLSLDDQKDISSIMDYFARSARPSKKFSALFPEVDFRKNRRSSVEILSALGIDYMSKYERTRRDEGVPPFKMLHFNARLSHAPFMDVKGYDVLIMNFSARQLRENEKNAGGGAKEGYSMLLDNNTLTLEYKGRTLVLAGPEQLRKLAGIASTGSEPPYLLEVRKGGFHVKYMIHNANFKDFGNGKIEASNISGHMLIAE